MCPPGPESPISKPWAPSNRKKPPTIQLRGFMRLKAKRTDNKRSKLDRLSTVFGSEGERRADEAGKTTQPANPQPKSSPPAKGVDIALEIIWSAFILVWRSSRPWHLLRARRSRTRAIIVHNSILSNHPSRLPLTPGFSPVNRSR